MALPRWMIAVSAALLALFVVAVPAAAAPSSPAFVRLAHLSPDTPPVDVYVVSVADPSRSFTVPGVGYGAVSTYRALDPGAYVVSMRPAGAPADSPPVISTAIDAEPEGAYTVAGVRMYAALGLSVLTDRLDMPAPGRASVRVINASVSAPVVDCGLAGQPVWAHDVQFGTATDYTDVPLGTSDLRVTAAGETAAALPVQLEMNSVYSVLLVDKDGALAVELHRDSTGSGIVPVGPIETGLGGTASSIGPGTALGVVVLAVIGGVLLLRRVIGHARDR